MNDVNKEVNKVVDAIDAAEVRGRLHVLRMLFKSKTLYNTMAGSPEYLSLLDDKRVQHVLLRSGPPNAVLDPIDAQIAADMAKVGDAKAWHDRYHALAKEHTAVLERMQFLDGQERKLRLLIDCADGVTLRAYINAMDEEKRNG